MFPLLWSVELTTSTLKVAAWLAFTQKVIPLKMPLILVTPPVVGLRVVKSPNPVLPVVVLFVPCFLDGVGGSVGARGGIDQRRVGEAGSGSEAIADPGSPEEVSQVPVLQVVHHVATRRRGG